ncbi:MAG TPA: ABC transporter permease [Bryobacteraceae bacterium]|nr:ABC transporter permease [Bryobacteraceae bacterium]
MRITNILRLRIRSLLTRRKVEQELDEELRYHLERQIDENAAAGMNPKEARYAALRSIEDIEQRKEECRDMRRLNLVDSIAQDFRYAIRGLRRNPGFALLATAVMALGIGANTAVFSVVNGVLLKPLAYRDPDRIVTLTTAWKSGAKLNHVTLPDFQDWHDQSTTFAAMAFYRSSDEPTTARSSAEYVHVARVSPEFFQTLAVAPVLGRVFSTEEQKSGDSGTALISYSYWQTHFGGSDAVLGQRIRISDQELTIVGVLPPRFHFPDKSDIWRPSDAVDRTLPRTSLSFFAIGRLKPNVTLEQAQGQLSSIALRLQHQYPESNKDRSVTVTRMRDDMVSNVRLTLYLLLGAVCLVLLIACANVATLLLTKATTRTREIAIRATVGAGRGRIIRQLITESLLLAFMAGAAGLTVAIAGLKALIALAPADVPRLAEASIDGRVLAFTAGVSVLCSLLFGLVPALYASRIDLNDALKRGGARAVTGGRSRRLRPALVITEIALSVVLLSGAGLLIKSFVALSNVALGFRPEHVLVMKTSLPVSGPEGEAHARRFFKQVLSAISPLPGVSAAGATMGPPGDVESAGAYWIDHSPKPKEAAFTPQDAAVYSVVTPGTFAALGIPLKRGRDFEDRDSVNAPLTAVINEALARKAFPGRDPIGRIIFAGLDSEKPMTIVGVVGDVRQWGPAREPSPEIYMPYEQHTPAAGATLSVIVRTTSSPKALTSTLRRSVHELAPDAPVKFTTMEAFLYEEVAAPRFRTLLLGVFAGLSLCLAMAGVYGVTAYTVGQRSNEIGLRMAMGATPGDVLRLILRHSVALAVAGMALGFVGSLAGTRMMTSLLFEVKPSDRGTYAGVAIVLGVVVLAATYLPARRAAKLDPLVALRQE